MRGTHCTAMICAVLALGASRGFAQTAAPAGPPPDLPARPYQLPPIARKTLANGMLVVVAPMHNVPVVTFRLAIPVGTVDDPAGSPGLAQAAADQLTEGTAHLTSQQINEQTDRMGGAVSATAGADFTTVAASALSQHAGDIAALLGDVVLHPAFPSDELAIFKGQSLQQLVIQRQDPTYLANEAISHVLYGTHPYGLVGSTPAAINALTHDRLVEFYHSRYTPSGSVLVIVGDIDAPTAFRLADQTFSGWSGGPSSTRNYAGPPEITQRHVYLVNRPGSVQSNILFGNLAISRNSPDYFALTVANTILGGSSESRLFQDVREKRGFAYDVRSSVDARALLGSFTEAAQTRTAVTVDALKAMLADADQLRTEPVSPLELEAAKSFVNGTFILRLTTQEGLAAGLLSQVVYHLPDDYLVSYRDRINAITAADVQQVAQKYFMPDKEQVVVVGDAAQLRTELAAIGDVVDVPQK